jgi:hypothetical protein
MSERTFNFATVTPETILMTFVEVFTILKEKFMTPALQANQTILMNRVATILKSLSTSRRQI